MKKLIAMLTENLESLRVQFIEKTKEFATSDHGRFVKKSKWNTEQWAAYLNVGTRTKKQFDGKMVVMFEGNFFNMSASRKYDREFWAAKKIAAMDVKTYVGAEEKKANQHFTHGIEKLAIRIMKKDLNLDRLTVTTAHTDVNINTTLTDGGKTVHAFTIIAGGPIQKPHYRYLIK